MRQFIIFFATGCYAGKIPVAPGTFGTAVGLLFYMLIHGLSVPLYLATVVAFIVFAVWVSDRAQKIFDEVDPACVVIDEIAGFLVAMAFHRYEVSTLIGAFILFRIFDIAKPLPLGWIEKRFPDGRGIVFDDVFAGVYANAALWIFKLIIPSLGIKL